MIEAFVYCWTDHTTNKLYVGSHKGSIEDGYIASCKPFLEQFKQRPHDFTRQIIAMGTYPVMRKFEAAILNSADAMRDLLFYNQHNGNGEYFNKGHTEATKKKIGAGNKGKGRGNKHSGHSEITKKKIGNSNRGKKRSEKDIQANSQRIKKIWQDPIYRKKQIAAHIGHKQSSETVAKKVAKHLGRKYQKHHIMETQ